MEEQDKTIYLVVLRVKELLIPNQMFYDLGFKKISVNTENDVISSYVVEYSLKEQVEQTISKLREIYADLKVFSKKDFKFQEKYLSVTLIDL